MTLETGSNNQLVIIDETVEQINTILHIATANDCSATASCEIPGPCEIPGHNNLGGLQGGNEDQRYHITRGEWQAIQEANSPSADNPFATTQDLGSVIDPSQIIQNQNSSAQSANFWISAIGRANTSFDSPLFNVKGSGNFVSRLRTLATAASYDVNLPAKAGTVAFTSDLLTALTGDGTASGVGSQVFTLATVNSNIGSFGSASSVPAFTVNAKGLITAVSNTAIQITQSQVTGLTSALAGKAANATTLAGYGITDAYTKAESDYLMNNYALYGDVMLKYENQFDLTGTRRFNSGSDYLDVSGSFIKAYNVDDEQGTISPTTISVYSGVGGYRTASIHKSALEFRVGSSGSQSRYSIIPNTGGVEVTHTLTMPLGSGTIARISDIPSLSGYVPYTGATSYLDLGSNDLYAGSASVAGNYTGLVLFAQNINANGQGAAIQGGTTKATSSGAKHALKITNYSNAAIATFWSDEISFSVPLVSTSTVSSTSFTGAGTGLTGTAAGLSIGGSAAQWGGQTYTASQSGVTDFIMVHESGGTWKYDDGTRTKALLGLGSNAYTSTTFNSGAGTNGYLVKYTGTNTQAISQIIDDGSTISIGASPSAAKFHITSGSAMPLRISTTADEVAQFITSNAYGGFRVAVTGVGTAPGNGTPYVALNVAANLAGSTLGTQKGYFAYNLNAADILSIGYNSSTDSIKILTAGTGVGNVSIGPSVSPDTTGNYTLTTSRLDAGTGRFGYIQLTSTAASATFPYISGDGNSGYIMRAYRAASSGNIDFIAQGNNGAEATGIGINSSTGISMTTNGTSYLLMNATTGGNVGIGTATPTEKLHVNGTAKANSFSGNYYFINGIGAPSPSSVGIAGNGGEIFINAYNASGGVGVKLGASGTYPLTVSELGIGINTAPSATYAVYVNGDVAINGLSGGQFRGNLQTASGMYIGYNPATAGANFISYLYDKIWVHSYASGGNDGILLDVYDGSNQAGLSINIDRIWTNTLFRLHGYTVAALPASPLVGDTAYVTNANSTTNHSVVAGGGSNVVPVFYNGTNWIIL